MNSNTKSQVRDDISSHTIKLTHTDPIKRLKEFCKQGKYFHQINWDRYANGFMFNCEITYNFGRHGYSKRRVLAREARWVETDDLMEGKRVIAAILLDNIGLGVSEGLSDEEKEEEKEETLQHDFTTASMEAVAGVLNQVSQQLDCEEESKDPILSMAGGLIKQMTTMISQDDSKESKEESKESQKLESWADIMSQDKKLGRYCI